MTAYVMRISDWSSYVCSSDLEQVVGHPETYVQAGQQIAIVVLRRIGDDRTDRPRELLQQCVIFGAAVAHAARTAGWRARRGARGNAGRAAHVIGLGESELRLRRHQRRPR